MSRNGSTYKQAGGEEVRAALRKLERHEKKYGGWEAAGSSALEQDAWDSSWKQSQRDRQGSSSRTLCVTIAFFTLV